MEAYQTPTADRCNRQAQLQYPVRRLRRSPRIGGRHLITLNKSGPETECRILFHERCALAEALTTSEGTVRAAASVSRILDISATRSSAMSRP